MKKIFRCPRCGRRLFDVTGGEPATALHIQCPRCKTVAVFDYTTGPVSPTSAPSERHPKPLSCFSEGENKWVNSQAKG